MGSIIAIILLFNVSELYGGAVSDVPRRNTPSAVIKDKAETNFTADRDPAKAAGKADLSISLVDNFPENPLVGETITFAIFVKNTGDETANNIKVEVKDKRGAGKSGVIENIYPGTENRILLQVTADESYVSNESQNFIITADPENTVLESNEVNNLFLKPLRINYAGKSDFVVKTVKFSPENPRVGDKLIFTIGVKNEGASNADHVKLEIKSQEGWANYGYIDYIPAGQTRDASISLGVDEIHSISNPHSFMAIADPDNAIAELNENNNVCAVQNTIIVSKAENKPDITQAKQDVKKEEPAGAEITAKAEVPIQPKPASEKPPDAKDALQKKEAQAEAYTPPPPAVNPVFIKLYKDLEKHVKGISGGPTLLQKAEFDSLLYRLMDEAESQNIFLKTEIKKHYSWWHQYPHNIAHKENTIKELEKIKNRLNITELSIAEAPKEKAGNAVKPDSAGETKPVKKEEEEKIAAQEDIPPKPELSEDEKALKGMLEDFLFIPVLDAGEVMNATVEIFEKMKAHYETAESDSIIAKARDILAIGDFYKSGEISKRYRFKELMAEISALERKVADTIDPHALGLTPAVAEEVIARYKKKADALNAVMAEEMVDVDKALRAQIDLIQEAKKAFFADSSQIQSSQLQENRLRQIRPFP